MRERDLAAWASDIEAEAWTRADVMQHHAIVSRIDELADGCLPARFGARVEPALLGARYEDLLSALELVAGRTELSVTVRALEAIPKPASGTAYLLARAARLRRAQRLADLVDGVLNTDVVKTSHRLAPSEIVDLSSALLVERSAAESIKARLLRCGEDVRILVNGPWPPYTFAAVGAPSRQE